MSFDPSYYNFCEKLKALGFKESDTITCRWSKKSLIIDVMPTDEAILGFTNLWYPLAVETAITVVLPSGLKLRHLTAPLLVATKLESFNGRGEGDFTHHDIEDIITVVDGRGELYEEVQRGPREVAEFIQQRFDDLLADSDFTNSLPGHLRPLELARTEIVIERMRQLAGI